MSRFKNQIHSWRFNLAAFVGQQSICAVLKCVISAPSAQYPDKVRLCNNNNINWDIEKNVRICASYESGPACQAVLLPERHQPTEPVPKQLAENHHTNGFSEFSKVPENKSTVSELIRLLLQISSDKFNGFIPVDKLQVTYSASSGPGGQNVNKVHTKCDVRFKVEDVSWLPAATKGRILSEFSHKLTKDGYYVIRSDLTRFRHMNLADALEKLRVFIRELEVEQKQPSAETVEKHKRRWEDYSL